MRDSDLYRAVMMLLALGAALPALADNQFRIYPMARSDVPPGKGQCDIRLQVDREVEVSVHRDLVTIRTIAGRDARNDGSECNAALPDRDLEGFGFQVIDSRDEIRLVAEPSRGNGFTAIVHILGSGGGARVVPQGQLLFRSTPADRFLAVFSAAESYAPSRIGAGIRRGRTRGYRIFEV